MSKARVLTDKSSKKSTITHTLREQIAASAREGSTYLEVGCDTCLTIASLVDVFDHLTAIDIDANKIKLSEKTLSDVADRAKTTLIVGTSSNIPAEKYDVVLIDAAHDYENVKRDFHNVVLKNEAEEFTVYFHDYGLVDSGVKKFVQEAFDPQEVVLCGVEKGWNPLGGAINDWEAARVVVRKKETAR